MGNRYWIGPWEFVGAGQSRPEGWNAPAGTVGIVDLRNRSDMGRDTAGDRPYGFFSGPDTLTLTSEWEVLGDGDLRTISTTARLQGIWESHTGYRPSGDFLVDLLWDQFTDGSDADGEMSVAPLLPDSRGNVVLRVAGHSPVKAHRIGRRIKGRSKWAEMLTKHLRRRVVQRWQRDPRAARKWLAVLARKYQLGTDWKHLVPPNRRSEIAGPLRPETLYSDNFDRSDENLNVGNWVYGGTADYEVFSNGVRNGVASGFYCAEHTSDLSSDDHWSEVEWGRVPTNMGPVCRSEDPTASTRDYYWMQRFGNVYLSKIVNGANTNIANASASAVGIGNVDRIEADGSTITGYINGSNDVSVTDTSITGSLRGGLYINGVAGVTYTEWQESDIAAGSSSASRLTLLGVG